MKIKIVNENKFVIISTTGDMILVEEKNQILDFHFTDYINFLNYLSSFVSKSSSIYAINKLICISCADGILAMCLNVYCPHILYEEQLYDLTFCHAFPLFELNSIQKNLMENIELIVEVRALVYKMHTDLVSFHTAGKLEELDCFLLKNRKRIRKCEMLEVACHQNLDYIFTKWDMFYKTRFNRTYSVKEILAFSLALKEEKFHINDFFYNGCLIASNLIYNDEKHQIQYDILAPWDLQYQNLGIGIYSIIYSVEQACLNQNNYSLCYGNYSYKLDLLGPFFERMLV